MKKSALLIAALFAFIGASQDAFGQSAEEMEVLSMYYKEEELVVTPTRHPKPLSQVAENITVITKEEIEAMNAHTLSDVLIMVPGIQIDWRGGPGSAVNTLIQGSEFEHVRVLIDDF